MHNDVKPYPGSSAAREPQVSREMEIANKLGATLKGLVEQLQQRLCTLCPALPPTVAERDEQKDPSELLCPLAERLQDCNANSEYCIESLQSLLRRIQRV